MSRSMVASAADDTVAKNENRSIISTAEQTHNLPELAIALGVGKVSLRFCSKGLRPLSAACRLGQSASANRITDCPTIASLGLVPTRLRTIDWQAVVVGHWAVRRSTKRCLQVWKCIVEECRIYEGAVGKWKRARGSLAGRSESEAAGL